MRARSSRPPRWYAEVGRFEWLMLAIASAGWFFDVAGSFTAHRPGLARSETLWRTIGKAAVLRETSGRPLVVLTAGLPAPPNPAADLLGRVCGEGKPIYGVVDLLAPDAGERLRNLRHPGG